MNPLYHKDIDCNEAEAAKLAFFVILMYNKKRRSLIPYDFMARVFARNGCGRKSDIAKENIGYMRIKRLKRLSGHKKSKLPPAEWQEYIEI